MLPTPQALYFSLAGISAMNYVNTAYWCTNVCMELHHTTGMLSAAFNFDPKVGLLPFLPFYPLFLSSLTM